MTWPLKKSIFRLKGFSWSLEECLQNIHIFGTTGSGKTVGSGDTLAHAFLSSGWGGLVCCFKKDEARDWKRRLKETGRISDGVFIDANHPLGFNFLAEEVKVLKEKFLETEFQGLIHFDSLVNQFLEISEMISRLCGTEEQAIRVDEYWKKQQKSLLKNLFRLTYVQRKTLEAHDLNRFLVEQVILAQKKQPFHLESDDPLLEEAKQFFDQDFRNLPEKTRATIVSMCKPLLDQLATEPLKSLFSGETNICPQDTFSGKIIVVDFSVEDFKELGAACQAIWKKSFQQTVLRRNRPTDQDRPVFLWIDEASNFLTEQDVQYFSVSREKKQRLFYYLNQ